MRKKQSSRRPHVKSRNGCLQCKKRHRRCGEERPLCTSCLVRGFDCTYPDGGGVELDDGGVAAPSIAEAEAGIACPDPLTLLSQSGADPFGTLPIKASYGSQMLLNFFIVHRQDMLRTIGHTNGVGTRDNMLNPWMAGNIMYQAAHNYLSRNMVYDPNAIKMFVYHKGELIKNLRSWIVTANNRAGWWPCLNAMNTLAGLEGFTGNIAGAEVHLRGMFALAAWERKTKAKMMYAYGSARIFISIVGLMLASRYPPSEYTPLGRTLLLPFGDNVHMGWTRVGYTLLQIWQEFIVDPETKTEEDRSEPVDSAVFLWFVRALEGKMNKKPDGWWVVSAAIYALNMAGVCPTDVVEAPENFPGGEERWEETRRNIIKLQAWYDGTMQTWMSSGTMPTWEMCKGVLHWIGWMMTPDGKDAVLYHLERARQRKRYAVSLDIYQSVEKMKWVVSQEEMVAWSRPNKPKTEVLQLRPSSPAARSQ